MKDYSNMYPSRQNRLLYKGRKNFELHYNNGNDGHHVTINGHDIKDVIIKKHTNPINANLEDKKMYYMNDGVNVRWGDEISNYNDGSNDKKKYMVVTRPDCNDVVSICRIRKMYDEIKFERDGIEYTYNVILALGLLYDASAYVNEVNVFTEEDLRSLLIQYDSITNDFKIFDDIMVNNEIYKIVQIDKHTLKKHDEEFGIVQLVVIKTIFGSLKVNGTPFVGVLRYARLKERVYNSKAREVLTYHNVLRAGDYIIHEYDRDAAGEQERRIYIVRSLVDVRNEYDTSFALNCDVEFNLYDKDDDRIMMIPAYVEDNRTMLQANDRNNNVYAEGSKYQFLVQDNKFTRKLGKEIKRILIKDNVYKVVGTDSLSLEGAIYVGIMDSKKNPSKDNFELGIADYYDHNDNEDNGNEQVGIIGESTILFGDQEIYQFGTDDLNTTIIWSLEGIGCSVEVVNNNSCIVKIDDNKDLIGKEVCLKAISDNVENTKNIRIVGW